MQSLAGIFVQTIDESVSFTSRGRTTSGMVAAVLIATVASRDISQDPVEGDDEESASGLVMYNRYDGYEEAYLNGALYRLRVSVL